MKCDYGFIPKKYRQPNNYRLCFGKYEAVYNKQTENGTETYYVVAEPKCFTEGIGVPIDHFVILKQSPDCRRCVTFEKLKTMKRTMEVLELVLS